jgi:hypothetical protein
MSHSSFADIDRRQRRRLVARSALNIAYSTAILVVLYIVLPAVGHQSGVRVVIKLAVGILVFVGLLGWRVFRIVGDEHPELRAAEAFVFAFALLIMVFAYVYLSMSRSRPANFSQPLDHVSALYFTVTVIGTVGFGDIAAQSDAARLIVTLQILLDLAVIAGIARTVVFAARLGMRRREAQEQPSPRPPEEPL